MKVLNHFAWDSALQLEMSQEEYNLWAPRDLVVVAKDKSRDGFRVYALIRNTAVLVHVLDVTAAEYRKQIEVEA